MTARGGNDPHPVSSTERSAFEAVPIPDRFTCHGRKAEGTIRTEELPLEKGEPLAAELTSFVRCVREHRDPVVTARHGSDALRLAVEICRRIREFSDIALLQYGIRPWDGFELFGQLLESIVDGEPVPPV